MRTSKTILRWWLIGYLTGDSTLQNWGLKTGSANPAIAARLRKLLGEPWVRPPRGSNRKKLYVFRVTDPAVIKIVMAMKKGIAPERFGEIKMRGWLGGYLDADGYVKKIDPIAGELMTIDWRLVKLITSCCDRLGISWSIKLDYKYNGALRKNPLFRIYARPLHKIPAVKIEIKKSRYYAGGPGFESQRPHHPQNI